MDKNKTKHRLTAADILTLLRMVGTALLAALKPLSGGFFFLYALTGVTDVLDGWIARKTNTESDFGARLDSAADLLFYAVMLLRVFPALWQALPGSIWYAVAFIVLVRLAAYLTAAVKYRRFASLHTYLNKFTGFCRFPDTVLAADRLRPGVLLERVRGGDGVLPGGAGPAPAKPGLQSKHKILFL